MEYKKIIQIHLYRKPGAGSCCPLAVFRVQIIKILNFSEYLPQETQNDALFQCNHCSQCVYKTVYKEHIRYINEKNRFGSAKRLKGIALKLFVIYHFCNPDEHGLIKSLSPKELATYLGCMCGLFIMQI